MIGSTGLAGACPKQGMELRIYSGTAPADADAAIGAAVVSDEIKANGVCAHLG